MKLRAFDLSERTGRLSRRSAKERWERLRAGWFLIAQCAVTAGLAWFVSAEVLDHPAPAFGPIAAVICLGVTYGQRLRRGVEVAIGVAVGIAVGDLFVLGFGTGTWQVIVVVAISMSLATLLGARQLMIIQAAVQSIVVTTLIRDPVPGLRPMARRGDRLRAGPAGGEPRAGRPAAPAGASSPPRSWSSWPRRWRPPSRRCAGATARPPMRCWRGPGPPRPDWPRWTRRPAEGLAVARQSVVPAPPVVDRAGVRGSPGAAGSRQPQPPGAGPAVRGALWRGEPIPDDYLRTMADVASVARVMARQLFQGRIPSDARDQLAEVAERTVASGPAPVDLDGGDPGPAALDPGRSAGADRDELPPMRGS